MKPAVKAMLLSGLVFPGLGQLVLGRTKRGVALMLTVLASVIALITLALRAARAILASIEAEGGRIDTETIVAAATQATTAGGAFAFNVLVAVIVVCWVIGIVDAGRGAPDGDADS